MSKVIHSGDFHLGGSHEEKAAVSAQFLIDQIHDSTSPAWAPDVILFGGDLTDRAVHVHSERLNPFYNLVRAVTCPVVLLQGTISHEPLGTINNIAALSKTVHVIDSPFTLFTHESLNIMGLPGLYRPQLAKWMKELGSEIDGFADPASAIRELLRSIGERLSKQAGPKIVLGHWSLSGCVTPTGQTMIGNDLEVGLDDLALLGADAVLLNHIHQSQEWHEPVFASYSGPPYPTSWGELHQTSFSVLEFDDETGRLTNFVRVPMPHKPMAKFDIEFTGEQVNGEWAWTGNDETIHTVIIQPGMEVKCCYSVPKEIAAQVDDMYIRTMFANRGLELAAVERTIKSSTRERIADIASKETTRDQYLAVCTAKGEEARPGALVKADMVDELGVSI